MMHRLFPLLVLANLGPSLRAAPAPLFDGPPPKIYAVDRGGQLPTPTITAPDHCAWPNLKLLKDGRTLDWNGLDGGYPSTVQRADGQVVTAYYASVLPREPWDSYKNYHMGVVVWDAEKTFQPR